MPLPRRLLPLLLLLLLRQLLLLILIQDLYKLLFRMTLLKKT